ncbi:hypothetical protein SAMN02745133_01947 [Desulforamulus putei DSM 12395]|uniref:Uncharacterized protein n=1 Tax=Desulforamulus putei DSM 12395 TaxID=1121429 RepID=A0A1M4ZBW7_9FIRM|nr:hypothetical protein [Desulforamulus putei]SHF15530.1 hypothetical protein SAMN02745133_01947 [Desulforamulus putei DSM 12395]
MPPGAIPPGTAMTVKEIEIDIYKHEEVNSATDSTDSTFEGFPAESIDLVLERIKYPVIILAAVYFGWNILMYCPEGFLFILLFSLIGLTIYGLIE